VSWVTVGDERRRLLRESAGQLLLDGVPPGGFSQESERFPSGYFRLMLRTLRVRWSRRPGAGGGVYFLVAMALNLSAPPFLYGHLIRSMSASFQVLSKSAFSGPYARNHGNHAFPTGV
jgi:hypothetical protein